MYIRYLFPNSISYTYTLQKYMYIIVEMGEQHNHSKHTTCSKVVFPLPPDKTKITCIAREKKEQESHVMH